PDWLVNAPDDEREPPLAATAPAFRMFSCSEVLPAPVRVRVPVEVIERLRVELLCERRELLPVKTSAEESVSSVPRKSWPPFWPTTPNVAVPVQPPLFFKVSEVPLGTATFPLMIAASSVPE